MGVRTRARECRSGSEGRERIARTETAYRHIKILILHYEIRPGQQLLHEVLCERLGMSSTPIREALLRLEAEGYVVQIPNRGFFVAEITAAEARHLFDVREALEVLAIERAIEAADATLFPALRECQREYRRLLQSERTRERTVVDQRFHLLIATATGNEILRRMVENVFERIVIKRTVEGFPIGRGIRAFEEHEEIVRAIDKGRVAEAQEAMREHIRNACRSVVEHIEQRQAALGDLQRARS